MKAGKFLTANTPQGIRESVLEVLKNPDYKNNAEKIGESLRKAGGAKRAADKIESICKANGR